MTNTDSPAGNKACETLNLRPATESDLAGINEIYNFYVDNSLAIFDWEKHSIEKRTQWFKEHQENNLPVLVATDGEQILGWASASKYSQRCGYYKTVELSIYILSEYKRKGLGRQLLSALISACKTDEYHAMLAIVASDNLGSIKLLKEFDFAVAGALKEVGYKFDRWLDVVIMQRIIKP